MTVAAAITFKWKPGAKEGVSFANLKQLQQYEPETYALFKQPVFDMQRIETAKYNYRIRSTKWGYSVTRFQREEQPEQQQQPPQQTEQQQQQSVSTQSSLAKLEATLSDKTRLLLELKKSQETLMHVVHKMNITLQELEREAS